MAKIMELSSVTKFDRVDWQEAMDESPDFAEALIYNDLPRAMEMAGDCSQKTLLAALAYACYRSDETMFSEMLELVEPRLTTLFVDPYGIDETEERDLAEMAVEAFGLKTPARFWDKISERDARVLVNRVERAAEEGRFKETVLASHPEIVVELAQRWEETAARALTMRNEFEDTVFSMVMRMDEVSDEDKEKVGEVILSRRPGEAGDLLLGTLADIYDCPLVDWILSKINLGEMMDKTDALFLFQLEPPVFQKVTSDVDWEAPEVWKGIGDVMAMTSMNSRDCIQAMNMRSLALDMWDKAGEGGKMSFVKDEENMSLLHFILTDSTLFARVEDRLDLSSPEVNLALMETGYKPYVEKAEAVRVKKTPFRVVK